MKTRILFGSALLLTLSTTVAGTLLYSREAAPVFDATGALPATFSDSVQPSAATIAAWKLSARTGDYINPKLPI